ncbi:MAG: SMC-Scp complex subunit ScpB, partial [Gemmatimonadetes bacterium]|nr:SMC-Scp complex subunit ScpB [Gemmatimonadota bacterium]
LTSLCKGSTGKDLRRAVDELNRRYVDGDHAMTITEVAGGFQFVTLKEFGPWVRKFHDRSSVRISQAALETLAILAFKQPVTRIEVDSIRGVDSGGVIRTLLELNMIRIVGRSEGVGRPMLFGTTREFMSHFGLKSLADLPRPKELEELLAEGERKAHEAQAHISSESEPDDSGSPESDDENQITPEGSDALPDDSGDASSIDEADTDIDEADTDEVDVESQPDDFAADEVEEIVDGEQTPPEEQATDTEEGDGQAAAEDV